MRHFQIYCNQQLDDLSYTLVYPVSVSMYYAYSHGDPICVFTLHDLSDGVRIVSQGYCVTRLCNISRDTINDWQVTTRMCTQSLSDSRVLAVNAQLQIMRTESTFPTDTMPRTTSSMRCETRAHFKAHLVRVHTNAALTHSLHEDQSEMGQMGTMHMTAGCDYDWTAQNALMRTFSAQSAGSTMTALPSLFRCSKSARLQPAASSQQSLAMKPTPMPSRCVQPRMAVMTVFQSNGVDPTLSTLTSFAIQNDDENGDDAVFDRGRGSSMLF